ncbi:MAG TPA: GNAT family N-acetyltransferase [Candidatus Angelobacter sp.]
MTLEHQGAVQHAVLRDLAEVEALAPQWDALLEQSHCNRAFSSSRWYIAWCRYHPRLSPFISIARRDGELAALLPLALREDDGILDFPSGMCDYNDLIASPEDLPAQDSLLEYALSHASCNHLAFSNIRPDSICAHAAPRVAAAMVIAANLADEKNCFYVHLPGSFSEYLATRSHIFRKGLGRARRNAQKGGLEVRQLLPNEIAPSDMAELFLSLNLSRFESKSGFAPGPVQQFVRELLPSLFIEGKMAAFILLKDNRVLAMDVCMLGRSSLCSWNGGFLPEAARWSPGRLLFAAGIEFAMASGFKEYDLLRGSHAYKASWATNSRTIGKLEFNSQSRTDALARHEDKSAYCL